MCFTENEEFRVPLEEKAQPQATLNTEEMWSKYNMFPWDQSVLDLGQK